MTAASGPRGTPAALRGALWMGGALLSFCVMAVAVRELLRTMGAFEILFLRSLVDQFITGSDQRKALIRSSKKVK